MLNNIELIRKILLENNAIVEKVSSMQEIFLFFSKIIKNKEEINFTYMLYYLFSKVSSNEVAKRKTSAREMEDFLAIIFGGIIQDSTKRKNNKEYDTKIKDTHIKEYVISNMREKIDVMFDHYSISVKTLMLDNNEINMGAFEKTALFSGFDIVDYLNERGKNKQYGLGSAIQLENLLTDFIYKQGKWEVFIERFLNMAADIFSHGILIAIKNNLDMDIYCLEAKTFLEVISVNTSNPKSFTSIINRWEGNSIRVKRNPFLLNDFKISLDFRYLDDTIVKDIKVFEKHLNYAVIKYSNNLIDNDTAVKELINELKYIFSKF